MGREAKAKGRARAGPVVIRSSKRAIGVSTAGDTQVTVRKHSSSVTTGRRRNWMTADDVSCVKDSDGGDEGVDEDAQNQIGFWLDETRDGDDQGGVGGHDDVSSLHEDDEEQDAQRSPELVRR